MGPSLFGKFALVLAMVRLLSLFSGFGGLYIFGRYVPEYVAEKRQQNIQALFLRFFWLRLSTSLLLGVLCFVALPYFLSDLSLLEKLAVAGSLVLTGVSSTFFQLYYGFNRLGRWLSKQSLTQVTLLLFITLQDGWHGLPDAIYAFFLAQLVFFCLGLFWTRHYFSFKFPVDSGGRFSSILFFGILFFATNLILLGVWRGGELAILLLTHQSEQVAYFNVANSISLAFSGLIAQVIVIIIPSLTSLHVSGEKERQDAFLGYSLKYLIIISFIYLFFTFALADALIALVLGSEYLPVAENLKILAFALLPLPFVRTGISIAMIEKSPRHAVLMTLWALLAFLIGAALFIPGRGSVGASYAIVVSMFVAAAVSFFRFPFAQILKFAQFWQLMALGGISVLVLLLPGISALLIGLAAATLYLIFLFWKKIVSLQEIRQIVQELGG